MNHNEEVDITYNVPSILGIFINRVDVQFI